ncbi:uncharacterized protein LOC128680317 [Plodia interpunctella]|uniref:uncharacterized protein LOC128680317 n=1 Tax=Plodia interpunctella TaxID=58824 RepID=UPI00236838D3|nr:uncharacterized protein LOC128680317 [Plodia interpunctella]
MKNVSSLKSNKIDSPKTPGGISKSLLTPCRRVGLSRNWRKGGPSPFVSPIPGTETTEQDVQAKRKIEDVDSSAICDVNTTPIRNVEFQRRKKSKILNVQPEPTSPVPTISDLHETTSKNVSTEVIHDDKLPAVAALKAKSRISVPKSPKEISTENTPIQTSTIEADIKEITEITPIVKSKSKSRKFTSPSAKNIKLVSDQPNHSVKDKVAKLNSKNKSVKLEEDKKRSPDNLTKECIVVIQKKLFKGQVLASDTNEKEQQDTLQTIDSDSDDLPLCQLKDNEVIANVLVEKQESPVKHKVENLQIQPRILTLDDDDDFMEDNKMKVRKLEDKTTSTTSLKQKLKHKPKENKIPVTIIIKEPQTSSQSSEDDDFDFNQKRTILIRKSYDKVTKPTKAKSTGSISQKDIDELKSRIEVKKKLLLAKAMNKDTEELRGLIKKWQKGCQDALTELVEIMRSKFPDKQSMEFSEVLKTLKIPCNLVGYDEDNDCFNTPDDESIVLAKFNDL